jgi:hypothetical protein
MVARGRVSARTDPHRTAAMMFACLQGGLVLMRAEQSIEPLDAGLEAALTVLRARRIPS